MNDTNTRAVVLDPIQRVSEIAFGLLMALSLTGTLSVVAAGEEEVRTMLRAAPEEPPGCTDSPSR